MFLFERCFFKAKFLRFKKKKECFFKGKFLRFKKNVF